MDPRWLIFAKTVKLCQLLNMTDNNSVGDFLSDYELMVLFAGLLVFSVIEFQNSQIFCVAKQYQKCLVLYVTITDSTKTLKQKYCKTRLTMERGCFIILKNIKTGIIVHREKSIKIRTHALCNAV